MHYPELFYGVNVGRIQKDKRHFPESIVGEFGDLNTEVLGGNSFKRRARTFCRRQ
ncbi:MAG: hypothetical protein AABX48_00475 [Nanoarchaeota archaeon]